MSNVPLYLLVDVLFGAFALASGFLVLWYRKNFTLHNGVAILLFAIGISSCTAPFLISSEAKILYVLYFFSRGTIPIFLIIFSEYILKISYHIVVKLVVLTLTWFFVIGSFFQEGMETFYSQASDLFFLTILFLIIIRLTVSFVYIRERLLKKYFLIFLVILLLATSQELIRFLSDNTYNAYSNGISSLIITHGVILIITSGGSSRLRQKLSVVLYILLFSVILSGLLKFFHSEIEFHYLVSLVVISVGILSGYYLFGEVSRSPKKIGSALLISRLLSLPLYDKELFLTELQKWEEITGLHLINHDKIEGNAVDLNLLFTRAGRVIHKNQIHTLTRALAFDPNFSSGIEVAQFYFKKFDCQSLFQISENGDFIAIKYMKGLNPALYANELLLMTKIVFSASGPKTT